MARQKKRVVQRKMTRKRRKQLKSLTIENLLNSLVGCSVVYADICEQFLGRLGDDCSEADCQQIVDADRIQRELVEELRNKFKAKPSRNKLRNRVQG